VFSIIETTQNVLIVNMIETRKEAQNIADDYNYQAANRPWDGREYIVQSDDVEGRTLVEAIAERVENQRIDLTTPGVRYAPQGEQ